jgi:hypothetical protein
MFGFEDDCWSLAATQHSRGSSINSTTNAMEILNNLCILVFIKLMVLSCSGFSAHWRHPCGVAGRLFKIQKWRQDTVRAGDQSRQIQCTNPIVAARL